MTATIVATATTIAVHSPYDRGFAYAARLHGGDWNRDSKVWEFPTSKGFTVASLQSLCQRFYPEVVAADAMPVPAALAAPEALPDFGYHGKVGDVVTLDLEITKTVDFTGKYGATRLHLMRETATGRVFTWYASSARLESGSVVRLMGKVKAHNTYKGTSQTILTRCKKV